ncbi:MAG: hypothetical protein BroJett040_15370 [Oligoflexia bacterium]|nr:MAG: hypothetical protein BroJett040_15370 [Oligoflexia bacterium]
MKSMTGYGLGKVVSSHAQIEVSLRAVNGRFLETRMHLPREFYVFEGEIKKMIEKYFERGTIDIFVSRKVKALETSQSIHVNKSLAKKYLHAYKELAKELKLKTQFHLEVFARLPDVIKVEDSSDVAGSEKKALMQAVKKACDSCEGERKREGKSLKTDLEKVLHSLEAEIEQVQSVREEANKNLLERFEQKIKSRMVGVEFDSARISQEVVIQLEKSDINEELTRLKEHLKNYHDLLNTQGPIGKKLDFYTQELLREVNTIGSKSSLSKLTQIVVQAKTLIERLREQVQNVE